MPEGARAAAAARMAEAAAAWRDALEEPQRAQAAFSFDDTVERTSWAYFPRNHQGLPLWQMTPRQQKRAHVLISGALSLPAYGRVCAIMALESVLNLLEARRGDAVRDPGRYFLSLFGTPGERQWGWRLEGHHVVLNFTVFDGQLISATPLFLGANPAQVRHGRYAVSRPCAAEEDAARELLALLDEEQRAAAVLSGLAPPDFVLTNSPFVPQSALPGEAGAVPLIQQQFASMPLREREALRFHVQKPLGLAASSMSTEQRALLRELIDVYIGRLPDDLATLEREKIAAGIDPVHLAWAGGDGPGQGRYYRLQAPGFLVEYDNTQDGANHVHAVWRSPESDFGADVLRLHASEHSARH